MANKVTVLKDLMKNPKQLLITLMWHPKTEWIFHLVPDHVYLKWQYRLRLNKKLDLRNPKSFNEKIQWLKIYNRNPLYIKLVDKYEVKKYVSDIIGDSHIIPTLGVWDKFEDIDFNMLPDKFVLKCTHDSGGIVICKDRCSFNVQEARDKINTSLNKNFYWGGREWPYKYVKPRIIAEAYMEDEETEELRDYKFFCFGGVAKCFKVDFNRFYSHRANYFTIDGDIMNLGEEICPPDYSKQIEIPSTVDVMKSLAEALSNISPFLRCDFYDVNSKVYFGELTFYPASGFGKFIDNMDDELLGSWIQLPKSSRGGT